MGEPKIGKFADVEQEYEISPRLPDPAGDKEGDFPKSNSSLGSHAEGDILEFPMLKGPTFRLPWRRTPAG